MAPVELLRLAVEDNIGWCGVMCRAHGSDESSSSALWANLEASPPYYPNIITRQAGAQADVDALIQGAETLRLTTGWGVKDSFCDLALSDHGFTGVVSAEWYGGIVEPGKIRSDWKMIESPEQLRCWETAWGGGEERLFLDCLLSDRRIRFWFQGEAGSIEAGFISFESGATIGISNWFSLDQKPIAQIGGLQAACSVSPERPLVCWSSDDSMNGSGLSRLGPLKVWIKTAGQY